MHLYYGNVKRLSFIPHKNDSVCVSLKCSDKLKFGCFNLCIGFAVVKFDDGRKSPAARDHFYRARIVLQKFSKASIYFFTILGCIA